MVVGLTKIRGVGYMFANTIINVLKINPNQRIGYLSPEQVKSIESIIKNPSASNFPSWFLNRRKDIETGEDKHLITSDIAFTVRNDIEREKTSGSWRGIRHMFGLKVRGQRTRCTGRKGGAVSVAKGGKIMPGREGAAAPGAEGEQLKERLRLKLKKVQKRRKHLQLERRKHLQLERRKHLQLERRKHLQLIKRNR